MGLSNLVLTTKDSDLQSILAPFLGIKLKLQSNASKKSLEEYFGYEKYHCVEGSKATRKTSCSVCGATNPTMQFTFEGQPVEVEQMQSGIVDIVGVTSNKAVGTYLVEKTYFVVDTVGNELSTLARSLDGMSLLGYARLASNSEERPVALTLGVDGELAMHFLYFDDELSASVPLMKELPQDFELFGRLSNYAMTHECPQALSRRSTLTFKKEEKEGKSQHA